MTNSSRCPKLVFIVQITSNISPTNSIFKQTIVVVVQQTIVVDVQQTVVVVVQQTVLVVV